MIARRVALAALATATLFACGEADSATEVGNRTAAAPTGSWTELPQSPLSARRSAHAFSIDGGVLIVGGTEADPCPPTADCVDPKMAPERDGALWNPKTEEWTSIAEAPVPLGVGTGAVLDGRLYLLLFGREIHPDVRAAFLSYDPATDRWTRLSPPPNSNLSTRLAAGESLVAYPESHEFDKPSDLVADLIYDTTEDSWAELPPDPLQPSFDRTFTATKSGFVLTAQDLVDQPGAEKPSLYRAAVLEEGAWRALPRSEVAGWNPLWAHSEGTLVNPTIVSVDGGETNAWGASYGTGGILDLAAERWSPLPDVPAEPGEFTGVSAVGAGAVAGGEGWVFDIGSRTWTELTRPSGAPETEAAVAWAGDELVVWGGARFVEGAGELLAEGWVWSPPSR